MKRTKRRQRGTTGDRELDRLGHWFAREHRKAVAGQPLDLIRFRIELWSAVVESLEAKLGLAQMELAAAEADANVARKRRAGGEKSAVKKSRKL